MDRGQIALKLTVDGLRLPFRIESFEDRLVLQKAVYLAQAAGVHLGYYYHWYLHGPYSPSLTRDEYAVAADICAGQDEFKGWTLDHSSCDKLKRVRTVFNESDRGKLARKLELLASVHFLMVHGESGITESKGIRETLEKFQKDFSENEVEAALRELREHGILQS